MAVLDESVRILARSQQRARPIAGLTPPPSFPRKRESILIFGQHRQNGFPLARE